ncbi:SpoIIE family protein phosphatase [Streptomyces sp. ISL-1]|uniref:SpoIIE family protein phosphatase n=1 Tax=Streptomyces sp. ISL-1 TaxID=2817657 RepID=UPI001BE7646D|nr:SpoIIE family protein phosphatase [Streptomyces sp. ISL-1]MBT2391544.1 SpoIIE family protein phosphatase [Streptomyces sp. ISL-1]
MTEAFLRDSAPAVVLVIDDDETSRYILSHWLSRAGHTVLDASTGTEGLALLASSHAPRPEAAIIDVKLPDMSGFEVCERIKGDPRTIGLPVIHISATAMTPEDHTEGLQRGADAYLDQPVDPDELLATVTAALRYARARRRAEHLARQLATLNRATLDVYRAIGFHSFAAAATIGAAALLSAPATALFLSPEGQAVHSVTTGPGAAPRTLPAPVELLSSLASHALGSGTGAEVTRIPQAQWKALLPLDHLEGDIVLAAARTKRGRPPIHLAVPSGAVSGSDDRELLQQLASACALSLEALRSYNEEHSLNLTLQKTFLPDRLPTVPGTELAVRYLPASEQAEIGGDFYEALDTPQGLLLAIGDVVGHSLFAATVMGEVRHALRAYALEAHAPHQILQRLEVLLAYSRPGFTVTVCLVLIDPDRRHAHVANAGHIPPLLLRDEGPAEYLHEHGPLLGLGLPHPPATTVSTAPGSRILLITDGLVEVRNEDLDHSLTTFSSAAASGPGELETLCNVLLERFGRDKDDDIALLAARLD